MCTVGICLCKQVSTTMEHISVLCGGYRPTCGARHTNATNNIHLYYYFNNGNYTSHFYRVLFGSINDAYLPPYAGGFSLVRSCQCRISSVVTPGGMFWFELRAFIH